jgi:putative DNA methylase
VMLYRFWILTIGTTFFACSISATVTSDNPTCRIFPASCAFLIAPNDSSTGTFRSIRCNCHRSIRSSFNRFRLLSTHLTLDWPPRETAEHGIYLSCGNSAATELPSTYVDLIITDPPFFDNVHYSELADFFFAWQQLNPTPFAKVRLSTRHTGEVQDASSEQFAAKLRKVFQECYPILRNEGLLVFTYHDSRAEGWLALADAVLGAGFAVVNCHPVKSEMSVAAPKARTKEPIQIDVIMICRKKALDVRPRISATDAFTTAVNRAVAKASRLKQAGINLSRSDKRVLLIGQFIVELCAGRGVGQVSNTVADYSQRLERAVSSLATARKAVKYDEPDASTDPQLVLLEQASKLFAA